MKPSDPSTAQQNNAMADPNTPTPTENQEALRRDNPTTLPGKSLGSTPARAATIAMPLERDAATKHNNNQRGKFASANDAYERNTAATGSDQPLTDARPGKSNESAATRSPVDARSVQAQTPANARSFNTQTPPVKGAANSDAALITQTQTVESTAAPAVLASPQGGLAAAVADGYDDAKDDAEDEAKDDATTDIDSEDAAASTQRTDGSAQDAPAMTNSAAKSGYGSGPNSRATK